MGRKEIGDKLYEAMLSAILLALNLTRVKFVPEIS